MKTTKRGVFRIVLCLVIVLILAILPTFWFVLRDRQSIGVAHPVEGAYTSRQPDANDYYLLTQLRLRTREQESDFSLWNKADNGYLSSGSSRAEMTMVGDMGMRAQELLDSLRQAGALPDSYYRAAVQDLYPVDSRVYASSDSLGILRLSCFPHQATDTNDPDYYEAPRFELEIENRTGKLLSLWINVPADQIPDETLDTAALLQSWVDWEGLADLKDWTAPTGTDYEQTGLYSASASTLLTCTSGHWNDYTSAEVNDNRYFSMQLNYLENLPTAERLGSQEPFVFESDLTPLTPSDDDGYYMIRRLPDTDSSGLLYRIDYATGEAAPYCKVPGCTHSDESCPAWIPGAPYSNQLHVVGDKVIAAPFSIYGGEYNEESIEAMDDEDFVRLYFATYENLSFQEIENIGNLSKEEIEALREQVRTQFGRSISCTDGVTRTTSLINSPETILSLTFTDGTYLYGQSQSIVGGDDNQLVRCALDGTVSKMILPQGRVVGVSNGQILLLNDVTDEPVPTGNNYRLSCVRQQLRYLLEVYRPGDTAVRCLYGSDTDSWLAVNSVVSVTSGRLLLQQWPNEGVDKQLLAVDLNSGEITPARTLLGCDPDDYASYVINEQPAMRDWSEYYAWNSSGTAVFDHRVVNRVTGEILPLPDRSEECGRITAISGDGIALCSEYVYTDLDWHYTLHPLSDWDDVRQVEFD